MFHFFFPEVRKIGLLFFRIFLALFLSAITLANSNADEGTNQIVSITSQAAGTQMEIRIKGIKPLISTNYAIPNPSRIIVDVAEAKLATGVPTKLAVNNQISLLTSEITDAKPPLTRLEFTLSESFPYTTSQDGNDIIVLINTKNSEKDSSPQNNANINESTGLKVQDIKIKSKSGNSSESTTKDKVSNLINQKKTIDSQLPKINPLEKGQTKQMQDAFNFSGYNRERISVEFQKMDLHNVFNFLRQVSGVNIVVDESVKGSLTLVLDNVPWDFALDIILNLKDLEKEERFNTLVIYPKDKKFKWPEQAKNSLSVETNAKVMEQESLVIKQQEQIPLGVVEAKQQIAEAREAEKNENIETAVHLYEKAFEKWPNNSRLANKIGSLYLVQLRQNAKGLYYAEKALEIDAKNNAAALNAAIASANMQDKQKAHAFFERCVNNKKPSKEALLSYAIFNEEQHDYAAALKMLEKHDSLYGNDLNAMLTAARIYDKMGKRGQASEKYQAILFSGFNIPQDLEKYIKGRVALQTTTK